MRKRKAQLKAETNVNLKIQSQTKKPLTPKDMMKAITRKRKP